MRRYYEIGQLVEVPRDVLVRHDGVVGLPIGWVLETAAEIEAAAAAVPAAEDETEAAGTADAESVETGNGWEVDRPDTLTCDGQTIKVTGQERSFLLHLMEGPSTIETVSAVVWQSSEYETDAIKSAAKRINRKLEAAGVTQRVVVTSKDVFLR